LIAVHMPHSRFQALFGGKLKKGRKLNKLRFLKKHLFSLY
jgi:hypothetical protein